MMPNEFFALKDELLAAGRIFSSNDLKTLRYPDLVRAAIGDAGDAACDLELVEAEQSQRLTHYLSFITLANLPAFSDELKEVGILDDLTRYLTAKKVEAFPTWGELTAKLRLHFLIRCLRSHADNPTARLQAVLAQLEEIVAVDQPESNLLSIIRYGADGCLKQVQSGSVLDLRQMRMKFKGYEYLMRTMTPWEKTVRTGATIQDYSCSAGCFTPIS